MKIKEFNALMNKYWSIYNTHGALVLPDSKNPSLRSWVYCYKQYLLSRYLSLTWSHLCLPVSLNTPTWLYTLYTQPRCSSVWCANGAERCYGEIDNYTGSISWQNIYRWWSFSAIDPTTGYSHVNSCQPHTSDLPSQACSVSPRSYNTAQGDSETLAGRQ